MTDANPPQTPGPTECSWCGNKATRELVVLDGAMHCVPCALHVIGARWGSTRPLRELEHSIQILELASAQVRARLADRQVADREEREKGGK